MSSLKINDFIEVIKKVKSVDKFAQDKVYVDGKDLKLFLNDVNYRRTYAALKNKITSELNLNNSTKTTEFIDFVVLETKFLLVKESYNFYRITRVKDIIDGKSEFYGYVNLRYVNADILTNLYEEKVSDKIYNLDIKLINEEEKNVSIFDKINNYLNYSEQEKIKLLFEILSITEAWVSIENLKRLVDDDNFIAIFERLKRIYEEKYQAFSKLTARFIAKKIKNSLFYVVKEDSEYYFRRFNYSDISKGINFAKIDTKYLKLFDVEYFALITMFKHKTNFNYYSSENYSSDEISNILDSIINVLVDNVSYDKLEEEIKKGLDILEDFEDIDLNESKFTEVDDTESEMEEIVNEAIKENELDRDNDITEEKEDEKEVDTEISYSDVDYSLDSTIALVQYEDRFLSKLSQKVKSIFE